MSSEAQTVGGEQQPSVLIAVTSPLTVAAFLPPIARALLDRGARVEVVSAQAKGGFEVPGVPLHPLPLERSANPLGLLAAALGMAKLVRARRPDVLVCATPVASLLGVLVGRALGVPRVIHLAWGLRSESLRGLARLLVRSAERVTVSAAHLTLANSSSLREAIVRGRSSLDARVECLGAGSSHGVDLSTFTAAPPPAQKIPVIGFVGRIRTDKGIRELLEATRILARQGHVFTLRLVGTVEEPALLPLLEGLPLVEHREHSADVAAEMRKFDIVVLPSWREGFPNVVLEASATARPVVVSDATGARDSVRDGITGLVVPARRSAELADALGRLLDSPDDRIRLGGAGRAWMEEAFDGTVVCARLAARVLAEAQR